MIDVQLLNQVSDNLKKKHLTIATAESCTGGLLANILTNISGSSDYFQMGVITYSNDSKIGLLNVPLKILEEYGAVSEQTAKVMANGVRKKANVKIGIATTGIAGPTGGSKVKPVGLVYIGITGLDKEVIKKYVFSGSRLEIKERTCNQALRMLLDFI